MTRVQRQVDRHCAPPFDGDPGAVCQHDKLPVNMSVTDERVVEWLEVVCGSTVKNRHCQRLAGRGCRDLTRGHRATFWRSDDCRGHGKRGLSPDPDNVAVRRLNRAQVSMRGGPAGR